MVSNQSEGNPMGRETQEQMWFDIFFVTLVACVGYVVVWAFVSGV
jgi:hypothetical protein